MIKIRDFQIGQYQKRPVFIQLEFTKERNDVKFSRVLGHRYILAGTWKRIKKHYARQHRRKQAADRRSKLSTVQSTFSVNRPQTKSYLS